MGPPLRAGGAGEINIERRRNVAIEQVDWLQAAPKTEARSAGRATRAPRDSLGGPISSADEQGAIESTPTIGRVTQARHLPIPFLGR